MPRSGRSWYDYFMRSACSAPDMTCPQSCSPYRTRGVLVNRLTKTTPHPLDSYVDGISNGADDAFREVYDALVDDLASFAFGLLSNRRTAEDVV